jgi:hypothetical protein
MLTPDAGLKIPTDLLSRLFRCPPTGAVQENSLGILIPPSHEGQPHRWALIDRRTGLPLWGTA